MANLLNRVWFTVTGTPGNASPFTVNAAVTGGAGQGGFFTPSGAGAIDGVAYDYVAVEGTAKEEVGRGTWNASAGTLSRDLVTESSAGYGIKETFTSACTVFLTARASSLVQVEDWLLFGAATDGNLVFDGTSTVAGLVPSAGVYTLTRDLFAANLTINGTAKLTGPYRLFGNGTLDLTGAGAGAIQANGGNSAAGGASGLQTVGGTAGSTGGTVPAGIAGQTGGAGNAGAGSAANSIGAVTIGGVGGTGGAGGAGTNAGGAAPTNSGSATALDLLFSNTVLRGTTAISTGSNALGGSGGGGDGTNKGGGGAGGAGSGGGVLIFAKFIKVSGAAAGAIQSKGGTAGAGGSPTTGNTGGAGGGGGGAGGLVYIVTRGIISGATNIIDVSGGAGGNGGSGNGTGTAGAGGTGGYSGRVMVWNIATNTYSTTAPVAGSANSGQTGGAGATMQVSL